jgi:hypothetical protein
VEICAHEWVNGVIINRILAAIKAYNVKYSKSTLGVSTLILNLINALSGHGLDA